MKDPLLPGNCISCFNLQERWEKGSSRREKRPNWGYGKLLGPFDPSFRPVAFDLCPMKTHTHDNACKINVFSYNIPENICKQSL